MTPSTEINRLFPSLKMQTSLRSSLDRNENFLISCSQDSIRVEAESRLAQEFAMHQVLAALQSKRMGEIVGLSSPLYAIRPLWLNASCACKLPSGVMVHFPRFLFEESDEEPDIDALSSIVWRILDLGFNTLIFAPQPDQNPDDKCQIIKWEALHKVLDFMQSLGLRMGLHFVPPHSATTRDINDWKLFFAQVGVLLESFDFLVWHQNDLWTGGFVPQDEELTDFEKAKEEIAFVEKHSKRPILYHFNAQDHITARQEASWIIELASQTAKDTILSFSSLIYGNAQEDSKIHPIFAQLSERFIPLNGKLLPYVVVNQLDSSDNEVADFPFTISEKILGRQILGKFCGAGCQTNHLPSVSSFAEGVLWSLGQRMWRPYNLHTLFENWLLRYHPDLKDVFTEELQERIHKLFRVKSKVDRALFLLSKQGIHERDGQGIIKKLIEQAVGDLVQLKDCIASITQDYMYSDVLVHESWLKLSQALSILQKKTKEDLESTCVQCNLSIPQALQAFEVLEVGK